MTPLAQSRPALWLEAHPKLRFLAVWALNVAIIISAQELFKLTPRWIQPWLMLATAAILVGVGLFQTARHVRDPEWRNPDRTALIGLPYILGGVVLLALVFADHNLVIHLPE